MYYVLHSLFVFLAVHWLVVAVILEWLPFFAGSLSLACFSLSLPSAHSALGVLPSFGLPLGLGWLTGFNRVFFLPLGFLA